MDANQRGKGNNIFCINLNEFYSTIEREGDNFNLRILRKRIYFQFNAWSKKLLIERLDAPRTWVLDDIVVRGLLLSRYLCLT